MDKKEKRLIEIEVANESVAFPSRTVTQFLAWLAAVVERVPVEFQENAKIEFEARKAYYEDTPEAACRVYYHRPETEQEQQQRIAKERNSAVARAEMLQRQLDELNKELRG